MIIIFGTRTLRKNYGVINKVECNHCHNVEFWNFIKIRTWFTLFWIPIIPLGAKKTYIVCPICESAIILNKEDSEKYEKLARLNTDFMNGKITEEDYKNQLED